MSALKDRLRSTIKAGRHRGALWVRALDFARLLMSAEGRSILWSRTVHRDAIHQTTPYTCEERYPLLFDLAAKLKPDAQRIMSFGCSTGEELVAIRRRFPRARIVGVEINPRSRKIAARRASGDASTEVVGPSSISGTFDVIFALAVLQREPHKVAELEVGDLTSFYPFDRFDSAVCMLGRHLGPGGLLCVFNAQYRVEDSSLASRLEVVSESPLMDGPLFGPGGALLVDAVAHSVFRKKRRDQARRRQKKQLSPKR